ncbi:MAG: asparagine synthase (glutamine-hydrolyzing) [Gammaproteobacteria bacterium]|nr:asparagine synthase (glutamine-hydrolyzing) [Gammaproteobacteria bacterium]
MCGISTILRFDKQPISVDLLTQMNRALSHRGPDAYGIFHQAHLGLGHTRLSIIDRAHGQQPMSTSDQRFTITFNGEIYNYQELASQLLRLGHNFKTRSDTEVLLCLHQEYGDRAISMLRGMFSYVLYDRESDRLLLVRDRLGIKPLYYFQDDTYFLAASEIKAIFASGVVTPELDPQTIFDHFYYQFSIPGHTSFTGIHEVLPGHYYSIDTLGRTETKRYWSLIFPADGEYENQNENYWKRQLEDMLDEVSQQHTVGEVPVGAYLSGGLDSSTTCHFLQKHSPGPIQTFSIHFENAASDESYAYKPVAEALGVANHELTIPEPVPSDFLANLQQSVYHLEQPQRMAVDIPHFLLSDFTRKSGINVVYTGDGADEIFGGYDSYRQDAMRLWGNQESDRGRRKQLYMEEFIKEFPREHIQLLWSLHQPENQRNVTKQFGTYPVWYDFWHILQNSSNKIWNADFLASINTSTRIHELSDRIRPEVSGLAPLNQSLNYEINSRLCNWILLKSDRLSMAHGVEARVPFLDHKLVELTARIPPQFKLRGMDEKYLLKTIMNDRLPQIPGAYKKRGFYTPIREWFFAPGRNHGDFLDYEPISSAGIFNHTEVQKILSDIQEVTEVNDMNTYYHVMRMEWMLMLVLTTQILYDQFVLKKAAVFHDIDSGARGGRP